MAQRFNARSDTKKSRVLKKRGLSLQITAAAATALFNALDEAITGMNATWGAQFTEREERDAAAEPLRGLLRGQMVDSRELPHRITARCDVCDRPFPFPYTMAVGSVQEKGPDFHPART